MFGDVIFVSGVYGVGKSTLCNVLGDSLNIPFFSSSDLISEKNGEEYGANKSVKNKESNQYLLIKALEEKMKCFPKILLAGHFCIFDGNNNIDLLPEFVYKELHLSKIILLEADTNVIIENLKKRDSKNYSHEEIEKLMIIEKRQAKKIASELNIPLIIHNMNFNEADFDELIFHIKGSKV